MTWIYIGTSELKAAYVGTTPVKEIYLGTTKVRPIEYDIDISNFKSFGSQTYPWWNRGCTFSKDGMHFYAENNTQVLQYTLAAPYDLANVSSSKTLSIPNASELHQVYISPDGTKLACWNYASNTTSWKVTVYTLTTPHDISTATNIKTKGYTRITGIWFKPDGTRMYVAYYNSSKVVQYNLATARDPSTAWSSAWSAWNSNGRCVSLSPDGQFMINATDSGGITQYKLSTPRDISTATSYKTKTGQTYYYPSLSLDGSRLVVRNWNYLWVFYEK